MFSMPSTTVLVAESCLSRLGRPLSSCLLQFTCRSPFLAGACLSFKTHTAVRSLGRSSVEVCPAKRGTPSHCRVDLDAEELDGASWNGLDLVGVNSEPEVVQNVDQNVVDVYHETNSHRTEVPNDVLEDLRGQPWGWCEAEWHRRALALFALPHEAEVLAILWLDLEMEEVV